MYFEKYHYILQRENRIIIINGRTGQWYKMSLECFNILQEAIKRNLSFDELLNSFKDEGDKTYFKKLLNDLLSLKIITCEYLLEPERYEITFALTNKCNLQCIHCSSSSGELHDENDLSVSEIKLIIDKLIKLNPSGIILTGGEPLVREDFFEIMRYIKMSYEGKLGLMTNGTLISEENAEEIATSFSNVSISIDGADSESCAKIRGEGVFEKVIASVRLLQKYQLEKISLSMTLTQYTYDLVEKFKKLNKELNTISALRAFAPVGRGKINSDILSIGSMTCDDVTPKNKEVPISRYACAALYGQLSIEADGHFYPCGVAATLEGFKLDKVSEIDDLKTYLDNAEYKKHEGFQNFNSILPGNLKCCTNCDVSFFCYSCPIYAYIYSKQDDFDKYCKYKKMENEYIWSM